MTVMSEGLLLNSKYIEMSREEEGFQALLTYSPLVIVCHKLIIWRLTFTVLQWSEMSVQYFMSSQVGKQLISSRHIVSLYILTDICLLGVLCFT